MTHTHWNKAYVWWLYCSVETNIDHENLLNTPSNDTLMLQIIQIYNATKLQMLLDIIFLAYPSIHCCKNLTRDYNFEIRDTFCYEYINWFWIQLFSVLKCVITHINEKLHISKVPVWIQLELASRGCHNLL